MEVVGIIERLEETILVSDKFKKREVVVRTNEQYPQDISIEFQQDKVDILNNYHVGQEVKVFTNLRGRSWTNPEGETKTFNTIQGWKIETVDPLG